MDSPEEVAAWVAEHEREHGNGVAGLRAALTRGIIAGRGALVARAWLEEHDHGDQRRLEAEQLELARRSTAASELAATAAVDSARHAGVSARWAMIAAGIAVVALLVSAWPLAKEWWASLPAATTSRAAAPSPAASRR